MVQIPLEINIFGQILNIEIIGFILFLMLFVYLFWTVSSKSKSVIEIFDSVFFILFSAIFASRMIALVELWGVYSKDVFNSLNLFDGKYSYSGLILGVVVGALLRFSYTVTEKKLFKFLSRVTISLSFALIPLVLAFLLSGHMLGLQSESPLAIQYKDGISRIPVAVISLVYNLVYIVVWFLFNKKKTMSSMLPISYILGATTIEFILRSFRFDRNAIYFGGLDLAQLIYILVFFFGIILLLNYYNFSFFKVSFLKNKNDTSSRKFSHTHDLRIRNESSNSAKDRFSLSFSNLGEKAASESNQNYNGVNSFRRKLRNEDK